MSEQQTGIRKLCQFVEVVCLEGGHPVDPPTRVVAAAAVVANPLAGRWERDLSPLIDTYSALLGTLLSDQAAELLGQPVEAFGKGAIVGLDGEVEHVSAIIHNLKFGNPVRARAGHAATLLPAAEKRAAAGASLDIPLKHVNDATTRSHHQTLEVRVPDAPRTDEILVVVAMAGSGRPNARLEAFGTEVAPQS